MKRIISFILALSIFAVSASSYYQGEEKTYKLSKDVKITQKNIEDYFNNGSYQRQSVNIIEANISERTTLKPTIANEMVLGLETLDSQSQRALNNGENVLASINCDMFYVSADPPEMFGIPINTTIIDGVLYTSTININESRHLPVVTIDENNKFNLEHVFLTCNISVTDDEKVQDYKSYLLNKTYSINGIATYSRRINSESYLSIVDYDNNKTYGVDKDRINLYMVSGIEDADNIKAGYKYEGTIIEVYKNCLQAQIPEGCIVISDYNNKMSAEAGDKVTFEYSLEQIDEKGSIIQNRNNIEHCVGAFNWLIKDGEIQTEELSSSSSNELYAKRYARAGIGFKEDGSIIAITVDCIADGTSLGMTMHEFAQLFSNYGAINAVNFDGGRSTQMMALSKNKSEMVRINTSTDGGSRPIATGLLFIAKDGGYKGVGESNNIFLIVGSSLLIAGLITFSTIFIINRKKRQKYNKNDG